MKWLMRYAGIIALVLAVISLEAMARDLTRTRSCACARTV